MLGGSETEVSVCQSHGSVLWYKPKCFVWLIAWYAVNIHRAWRIHSNDQGCSNSTTMCAFVALIRWMSKEFATNVHIQFWQRFGLKVSWGIFRLFLCAISKIMTASWHANVPPKQVFHSLKVFALAVGTIAFDGIAYKKNMFSQF